MNLSIKTYIQNFLLSEATHLISCSLTELNVRVLRLPKVSRMAHQSPRTLSMLGTGKEKPVHLDYSYCLNSR